MANGHNLLGKGITVCDVGLHTNKKHTAIALPLAGAIPYMLSWASSH